MNNDLEGAWKEAIVAYCSQVLSQYSPVETMENQKKNCQVARPNFEPRTS
jgi:hypothetical protein